MTFFSPYLAHNIFFDFNACINTNVVKNNIVANYTSVISIENQAGSLLIYPNPSTEIFHIVFPESNTMWTYFIYDSTGKLISSKSIAKLQDIIQLKNLNSGIFLISAIISSGKVYQTRFVVQNQ